MRENNARQLRLLTIHEAVPGHYLQLAYSNRTDSMVRGSSAPASSPRAGRSMSPR